MYKTILVGKVLDLEKALDSVQTLQSQYNNNSYKKAQLTVNVVYNNKGFETRRFLTLMGEQQVKILEELNDGDVVCAELELNRFKAQDGTWKESFNVKSIEKVLSNETTEQKTTTKPKDKFEDVKEALEEVVGDDGIIWD